MKTILLVAIPALALFASCGQSTASSTSDHVIIPDESRAFAACGSLRSAQKREQCEAGGRNAAVCDKSCVTFESEFGGQVKYECARPTPLQDNGTSCNYQNTWIP